MLTGPEFTKDRPRREIEISISASIEKPVSEVHGVSFIKPRETIRDKQPVDPEWADLPTVYIQFAVEDTGRGLSPKEMEVLFNRFSQASPKTCKCECNRPMTIVSSTTNAGLDGQYGGSGLGLFISRELAELSGGQIGVASMGKNQLYSHRTEVWKPCWRVCPEDSAQACVLALYSCDAYIADAISSEPRICIRILRRCPQATAEYKVPNSSSCTHTQHASHTDKADCRACSTIYCRVTTSSSTATSSPNQNLFRAASSTNRAPSTRSPPTTNT